jgi:hypothetical protein
MASATVANTAFRMCFLILRVLLLPLE